MAKRTRKSKEQDTIKKESLGNDFGGLSDEEIQDVGYNPLLDEPIAKEDREYTKPQVDTSELPNELEEPIFKPVSLDDFDDPESDEAPTEEDAHEPKRQSFENINPQFNELPNKDKKRGAEQMADIVIDGYGRLGKGMGMLARISEDKISREVADGNIDPNIELPIDAHGNTASIMDFVKEFNIETSEAFETSEEFVQNVRPPLVRVFQKRGVGLTDEQLLIYYFGTDFAAKGITLFQLRKTQNGILENLRAQTQMMQGNTPPPRPEPKPASPPPSQPPPPTETAVEFMEPEEDDNTDYGEPIVVGTDIQTVQPSQGFAENPRDPKMPVFGNKELLEDMEKLAKREEEKSKKKK